MEKIMTYVTFEEYQTYNGETLETTEQTLLTVSLIPEAEELIERTLGFGFNVDALTTKKFDAEVETAHSQLFFRTWANTVGDVTFNGSVIDPGDYVLIGEGPYYGVDLLDSSGLSWHDFGTDRQEAIEVSAKWGNTSDVPAQIKKLIYKYIQDSLANRSETEIDPQNNLIERILELYPSFRPFAIG